MVGTDLKCSGSTTWKHQGILRKGDLVDFVLLKDAMRGNSCGNYLEIYDIAITIFVVNNFYLSSCSGPPCKCTNLEWLFVVTAYPE